MKGLFITLEGIDGAGKSTNISFIKDWLRKRDKKVLSTREPGGTVISERIRSLLLDPECVGLAPEAELLLLFAARIQHWNELIRPALEEGQVVLCERFTHSTYAYQGGGRGLDPDLIAILDERLLRHSQPDLILLLDLPVEQAIERRKQNSEKRDRFHEEPAVFLERVRQAYQRLDRKQKDLAPIYEVDASRPLPEVQREIAKILESAL